jgi:hypothetical protein
MNSGELLGHLKKHQLSKKQSKSCCFDRVHFSYVLSVLKRYVNYYLSISVYLDIFKWSLTSRFNQDLM